MKEAEDILQGIKDFIVKYRYFVIICFILTCGIFLRLEAYSIKRFFGFDEAQLVYNITQNSGILWAFKPLENYQIAPPLFLIFTKFFTLVFNESEYIFRLLPFIAGILSVFVFYILSKQFLSRKRSIIFANFLFAINYVLVSYSVEFKQYQTDVLIFMLILIWLNKKSLQEINFKEGIKIALLFTIFFFISQPTIFLLFGFILYNFLKPLKPGESRILRFKLCLIPIIPLIFVFLYKLSIPKYFSSYMNNYWEYGFLSFKNFVSLIKKNFDFFMFHGKYLIPLIPFMIIGFFIFAAQKNRINKILLYTFLGIILASVLHLYPLAERLILYLTPYFIIFISKCFDFNVFNSKIDKFVSIALISFVLVFMCLFQTKTICKNNMKPLFNRNTSSIIHSIITENFDTENDVLILAPTSRMIYFYYSNHLNFHPKNIIVVNSYKKEHFVRALNSIKPGKTYWLYLAGFSSDEPCFTVVNNNEGLNKAKKESIEIDSTTSFCLYLIRL